MRHVRDNAEESVRRVIGALKDGEYAYEMDNGAVVRVGVAIHKQTRSATIDFTGTSAQLDDNFNAPSAVTRAAVLYVFRTLVDDDIPLNDGCAEADRIDYSGRFDAQSALSGRRRRRQRRNLAACHRRALCRPLASCPAPRAR